MLMSFSWRYWACRSFPSSCHSGELQQSVEAVGMIIADADVWFDCARQGHLGWSYSLAGMANRARS